MFLNNYQDDNGRSLLQFLQASFVGSNALDQGDGERVKLKPEK